MRTVSLFREQLIPAWAGKTSKSSASGSAPQAHPRVGEENASSLAMSLALIGSSPRGRGKLHGSRRGRNRLRLIPAWAGKTSHGPDHRLASTAHPRAGGENADRAIARAIAPRLIPARAGKTHQHVRGLVNEGAHPRAGGENWGLIRVPGFPGGSSPRGRGKLHARR